MVIALSDAAKAFIDAELLKYPTNQRASALLATLKFLQAENGGWLSKSCMQAAAEYLKIPEIAVFEVATFYSMFELNSIGRHKVGVCNTLSCTLRGSEEILKKLREKYPLDDEKLSIKPVECLGACIDAPIVTFDGVYHEKITDEKLMALIEKINQTLQEIIA